MVAENTLKLIYLYLEYLLILGWSKLEIGISNEKLYNFLVTTVTTSFTLHLRAQVYVQICSTTHHLNLA